MSGAHFHLAFNHVPVVLVPIAVIMLAYALARKSTDLTKSALVLLVVSTLFGVAAFMTGEPAEKAVTQIAGISRDVIEAHEEFAPFAALATGLAGTFAFVILLKWRPGNTSWAIIATLVVACVAAVLLAWTAYLGGRINHPELRDDPAAAAAYK